MRSAIAQQPAAPLRFPWWRYGIAALVVLAAYALHEYIPPDLHSGPIICLITATLAAFLIEYMRRQANKVQEAGLEAQAYARRLESEITRREQLESDLIQARQSAEQANAAKDRFLATLSHELRTPLMPVLGAVSLLQKRADIPNDVREALSMIRRNAQLEARLIDDLLDLNRIAGGKLELRAEETDPHSLLQEIIRMCREGAEGKRLSLSLQQDTQAARVWGDPARLSQVFWNLINNAIKFTTRDGSIVVRTSVESSESGALMVEVRDTGAGIAPEVLPLIFLPFEQGGRAVTRQFGGLGLGLAISKTLVEMHGGSIEAHSEGKGKGAAFKVHLPLMKVSSDGSPDAAPHRPEPRNVRSKTRSLRVLVVEDHADTAEMIKRMLEAKGHQVQTAGDVAAALDTAAREDFDVLISDLGLPDGSGSDLMRELRNRGCQLPGIALSGYGQEPDIRQSRDAGFTTHLVKPVDMDHLLAVVADVAGSRDLVVAPSGR